jgi:hypothetical protein
MKYIEVKEALISEVNMSPSSLRTLAADIDARAGMEFEMYVPGARQEDDDSYSEPDMDSDESINSIQDAFHFYYDGDHNSRRDAQELVDTMRNDYIEWLGGQLESRWDSDMTEVVYRWIRENADEDDIAEILGKEFNEENEISKQDYIDAADKVVEDQIDPWYDDAYQDFSDDFYNDTDLESEWLDEQGISTMWDVQDNYSINWPHYYSAGSGGEVSVEDAADSFSRAIGRRVEASGSYHSGSVARPSAKDLHYVVEPDGSLDEPDDDGDGGLEFVSPALPITELLDDLKKVKAWADKTGCYTNDSTGLHINVSVPGWQGDLSKLDYVKLAVLLGDEYVLKEFGRTGNTYARSALKIVKDHIAQQPDDAEKLLNQMKDHLNTSAAKIIHNGSTTKYTSINTKNGYIEFRSPGGDWLNENFDKIETTLLRFVVAMDAAADETKYKQEYAKKLYKLLNPKEGKSTLTYFAQYAAGELPKQALKSFIRQAQLERKVNKEDPTAGKKYWWRVSRPGYGASVEVVATSREEAIEKGKVEYPDWSRANDMEAKPVRPFETYRYEIYNKQTGNALEAAPAKIDNDDDAAIFLDDYIQMGPHRLNSQEARNTFGIRRLGSKSNTTSDSGFRNQLSQTDIENRLGWGGQAADANYEIVDRSNNRSVFKFIANTDSEAQRKYTQVLDVFGFPHDTENYGYRSLNQSTGPTSRYEIYRISDGRTVEHNGQPLYVNARNPDDAEERARQVIAAANLGAPQLFDVRSVLQAPAQTSVQGSTQDLQQQRAQGGFTGSWQVVDNNGRELYRFSGVGNSQSDANRVAQQWVDTQRRQGRNIDARELDVLPIMG